LSDLYRKLDADFGNSAPNYDREAEANPAMAYMRRASLQTLKATFSPGQRVLELGCGTGEEAIALGKAGVEVLATDVSAQMLAVAQGKVAAAELEQIVQTRRLAAGEVGALLDEVGAGALDGAYSSFGALNGEPDLGAVGRALAALVRPGGRLAASVMNRFYPFEVLWFLGHGRPREAVRRLGGSAMAHVSPALTVKVRTWYWSPRDFVRAFPAFRRVSCRALPLLLPPPYAAHLWARLPAWMWRLARWDERLAGWWPFCGLGDHFLMVLERLPGGSVGLSGGAAGRAGNA
jgi:SAM-dependent methyltransferase